MRPIVFVVPFFLEISVRFLAAAVAHAPRRVVLVSQDPVEKLPARLRRGLAGHLRVANALDPRQIAEAIAPLARGGVHRLLGTLEQLQVPLAEVREELGIPGMGVQVATNFRDKARMKTVLRAAGVPCARHRLVENEAEALAFAAEVGFPIVVKPPAGAGAKATDQATDPESLHAVLQEIPPAKGRPVLCEEFVQGDEQSFDGVSIDGKLVWHSLTHYQPTPLDAVRNRWIQWCVLLPREIDHPRYDDARAAVAKALDALGMVTGVSHLEWFRRPDGSLAISEVGARPGGAQISRLMSYAHEFDFYAAWAQLEIDGVWVSPKRRWATGAAFLRGQGRGRVQAVRGLEKAQQELGSLVVEAKLPRRGALPSSSYEGDGFVILRHRDTQVVEKALRRLVSIVRVELG